MTLADYSERVWPATPRILGVALRPLTLGHVLLLARLGSPFMAAVGAPAASRPAPTLPERGDLFLALAVCSRDPFHPPSSRRLWWLNLRHCQLKTGPMLDACLAFNGWLRESCRVPDYWSECNGDAGNTPLFQSVKLTLRTEFQCTEEEALRTPVSLALADCFALWDARGNLELITDEDAECMRLARRMHAERMAGENGASRN